MRTGLRQLQEYNFDFNRKCYSSLGTPTASRTAVTSLYVAYCDRTLNTEFPGSVTNMEASIWQRPFPGMIRKGNVNTPLETANRSRIDDKQLLSLNNCSIFYCRFALVLIN